MKIFPFAIYSYLNKKYNDMFKPLLKKYQITQIEIDILAFLANNPEFHNAQDIVNVRGISKAHASIGIEKLVKKGYVTRQTDPTNRRCNILLVTKNAQNLVKDIQDIQKDYNEQLYLGVSQEDKEKYNEILAIMYQNFGGYKDE